MPPLKAICGRSAVAVGLTALVTAATSAAGTPSLRFEVFARNIPASDSIVWTGSHFIYVQNTMNRLWEAPPTGGAIKPFARMPRLVEETRCVLSPGAHGFAPGAIFCHSPNHRIYEFSKDGRHRTVFAVLPARYPPAGDGALAFDDGG